MNQKVIILIILVSLTGCSISKECGFKIPEKELTTDVNLKKSVKVLKNR
jgi:hypothetical protein